MPPLMAWQLRYNQELDSGTGASKSTACSSGRRSGDTARAVASVTAERGLRMDPLARGWVPGGKAVLALLCASAVAVEAGQAALSLGH